MRLVIAEGIFESHGFAEMRSIGSGNERAGAGLVEAHSGKAAAEVHREIISGIGFRARGEGALGTRWDFFDSHDAGNFLNEIGFAAEFAAVTRNAPAGFVTGSEFFQADTGEGGFDFGIREQNAQEVAHTRVAQGYLAAFWTFA